MMTAMVSAPAGRRQGPIIGGLLFVGAVSTWLIAAQPECRSVETGFWFEPVAFSSARLGGQLTAAEIDSIASVARAELDLAFSGLGVRVSERHDARYRVRVVQQLRDMRFRREILIPAQSRAVTGLGGDGAVSFSWLASAAAAYAPADAPRDALIDAIGKGIGRAAVHELVHQLLPKAAIHESADVESYEYRSAARRQQYFGPAHWDVARPLLEERAPACPASVAT